jgi:hypothetical protein
MRLAINKIIHHDDVILAVVVRTWSNVACCNSHAGYTSIVKYDTEKRDISITWRRWDKTAEQQLAVGAEILHPRAGSTVAVLFARATSIRLIDVSEDCAEATNSRRNAST